MSKKKSIYVGKKLLKKKKRPTKKLKEQLRKRLKAKYGPESPPIQLEKPKFSHKSEPVPEFQRMKISREAMQDAAIYHGLLTTQQKADIANARHNVSVNRQGLQKAYDANIAEQDKLVKQIAERDELEIKLNKLKGDVRKLEDKVGVSETEKEKLALKRNAKLAAQREEEIATKALNNFRSLIIQAQNYATKLTGLKFDTAKATYGPPMSQQIWDRVHSGADPFNNVDLQNLVAQSKQSGKKFKMQ
jgi:septal ring factor EnvC (AmiA/AmiB activator)